MQIPVHLVELIQLNKLIILFVTRAHARACKHIVSRLVFLIIFGDVHTYISKLVTTTIKKGATKI